MKSIEVVRKSALLYDWVSSFDDEIRVMRLKVSEWLLIGPCDEKFRFYHNSDADSFPLHSEVTI